MMTAPGHLERSGIPGFLFNANQVAWVMICMWDAGWRRFPGQALSLRLRLGWGLDLDLDLAAVTKSKVR